MRPKGTGRAGRSNRPRVDVHQQPGPEGRGRAARSAGEMGSVPPGDA